MARLRLDSLLGSITRVAAAWNRSQRRTGQRRAQQSPSDYPGDFVGIPAITYTPAPGRTPDPGEIVWTWVPYEEDHSRGKDRPVLLIGRDGPWLLGLPLTSKDHDRDARQEASEGRYWTDIGTGDWDRERRPSEVRVDRVIRVDPTRVRRTTVALERDRFGDVASAVREHHG